MPGGASGRADLAAQRATAAKALASLQVERAGIEGQRKLVEADVGPVRYLATLLGADSETALRWFVLVVASCRSTRPPNLSSICVAPDRGIFFPPSLHRLIYGLNTHLIDEVV